MISTFLDAAAILAGGLIGLLAKNRIRKKLTDAIMIGIGLFTVYTGITGLTKGVNALVYLLAVVFGGVSGTALGMDDRIGVLAKKVQDKMSKGEEENRFASGFTGFMIISGVGAFTIVASFNAGMGDHTMMYTKCVMDFVVAMAMAASLGTGVLFGAIPVILYEAILVLFAGTLTPLMSETMIEAFSCTGAILTVAIGLNVAGISDIKVVNYIPALVYAPLLALLAGCIHL